MDLPKRRDHQHTYQCTKQELQGVHSAPAVQLFLIAPDTALYMCSCLANEMHFHPETPRGFLQLKQTDISQHETIAHHERYCHHPERSARCATACPGNPPAEESDLGFLTEDIF
jgi:hypothetical protein